MGQATQQGPWDLMQAGLSGCYDPADLQNPSLELSESTRPSDVSSNGQYRCVRCLYLVEGRTPYCLRQYPDRGRDRLSCAAADCTKTFKSVYDCIRHEREHFYHDGKYRCNASNCTKAFKRFDDLIRHVSAKHCENPQKFPCPLLWCKYSGDNGFTRRDKLKSHYKNVHEGKPRVAPTVPRAVPRAIFPAADGALANTGAGGLAYEHGASGRENKRVRRY